MCRNYANQVKIGFCKAPYLSISIWKQTKSQALRDKFLVDDCIIEQKIDQLNEDLQTLNRQNGIDMPKFALDTKTSRKSNKSYTSRKI